MAAGKGDQSHKSCCVIQGNPLFCECDESAGLFLKQAVPDMPPTPNKECGVKNYSHAALKSLSVAPSDEQDWKPLLHP